MARFCSTCGAELRPGASYCETCGSQIPRQSQDPKPAAAARPATGWGAVREGIPAPGYSDRVNHPEILASVKRNKKAAGVFSLFLVPLPLIGFVVYSLVTEEMEIGQAALYGGIVSGIFLLFALYGFIKARSAKSYEAVVIGRKQHLTHRHINNENPEYVTEYSTLIRTVNGKKKKIVEWDGSQVWAYHYLKEGDRFKYHPQFHFPYELYDKSRAPYIACVSCAAKNPVTADRCGKCGLPLLK